MYFAKIVLTNFGPFSDAEFSFEPHAINWIIGRNGSGKTQMAGAMLAALVGRPALVLTPGGVGPSSVVLSVTDRDTSETVGLHITEVPSGKPEVSKANGPLVLRALTAMSGSESQLLMIGHGTETNHAAIDFHEVETLLPDRIKLHPLWEALRQQSGRAHYIGSGAQRSALELIIQFVARRRASVKLPLIVDEVLWRWSRDESDLHLELLVEIARESQVLVLCPHRNDAEVGPGPVMEILPAPGPKSLAAFNSWYESRKPNIRPLVQKKWVRGEQYPAQESRTCEFKEIKGSNPLGAIRGVVDQYAVAFMNAGLPQEGAIFWGIRDADRAIVGVELRPQDCDELRRIVTERLHQIVPPIAPTAYRIDLHPVSSGSVVIENLYVVEVRVPSVRRTLLFATGAQEVYVKTDAGKRKLSALELQQELIQRIGVDPGL
ncbi:ATP-binding protein [Cupriavidus pampae]|uniref:ATP-binding protein n=1 Tax=Cupriavidus pampae TaxID=659251 RepID=A0ABM8WB67_9BURK|nr:ATP-binding protein [Cupriavidus pampae]CAG9164516.1 hypothetical protein LMG32289_00859 [Cupriavidus pampae]